MLVQFCHFGDPHRDCKDLNPPPTLTSMRGDTNQLTTSVMILNWNNTLASTIDKIFGLYLTLGHVFSLLINFSYSLLVLFTRRATSLR